MNLRMMTLGLTVAATGAVGAVGGVMLAQPEAGPTPAAAEEPAAEGIRVREAALDACRPVVKRLRNRDLSDAQLKRVLEKYPKCRATVLDSSRPGAVASLQAPPTVITLPAPAPSGAGQPASYDGYEDEEYEGDEYEYEDDDEYEHEDDEYEEEHD